jgi:hypothetical protein
MNFSVLRADGLREPRAVLGVVKRIQRVEPASPHQRWWRRPGPRGSSKTPEFRLGWGEVLVAWMILVVTLVCMIAFLTTIRPEGAAQNARQHGKSVPFTLPARPVIGPCSERDYANERC